MNDFQKPNEKLVILAREHNAFVIYKIRTSIYSDSLLQIEKGSDFSATFYQVTFCFCPSFSLRETLMIHVVRTHSCPAGYGAESSRWKSAKICLGLLYFFAIVPLKVLHRANAADDHVDVNSQTLAFWLNTKQSDL